MASSEIDGTPSGGPVVAPPAGPAQAHGVAEARSLFDREILGRA